MRPILRSGGTLLCYLQPEPIYGTLIYTEDSAICKAGEHMGVNKPGIPFTVMVQQIKSSYEGANKAGIQSLDAKGGKGTRSITFQPGETVEATGPFVGMLVLDICRLTSLTKTKTFDCQESSSP